MDRDELYELKLLVDNKESFAGFRRVYENAAGSGVEVSPSGSGSVHLSFYGLERFRVLYVTVDDAIGMIESYLSISTSEFATSGVKRSKPEDGVDNPESKRHLQDHEHDTPMGDCLERGVKRSEPHDGF